MQAGLWIDKGNALHDLGRHAEALVAYGEALRLGPTLWHAWNGKGNALSGLGRYAEALTAFDEAIRLDPKAVHARNGRGNALRESGRHTEALEAFGVAIRLDPTFGYVWYGKGNVLRDLGRHRDALVAFNEATRLDPTLWYGWDGKGSTLRDLGRHAEALDAFDEAIRLNSKVACTWNGKGRALQSLGQIAESLKAFDEAIRLDPTLAYAWIAKGYMLRELGQIIEALDVFDKAISLIPSLATLWTDKGNMLHSLGRQGETLVAFDESIRLDPTLWHAWNGRGNALRSLSRYAEALDAYDMAIRLDPEAAHARNGRGNALAGLGRHAEALNAFDDAIRLDPTLGYAWNGMGNVLRGLGRHAESLDAFDKAFHLLPEKAETQCGRGGALYGLNRIAEALEAFDEAIRLDPTLAYAWTGKGSMLEKLNRPAEALSTHNEAIRLFPSTAEPWNGRGNALDVLGRPAEALDAYNEAIRLDPTLAHVWNGKGNVLKDLKRSIEALDAHDKAISLDPSGANQWNGRGDVLDQLSLRSEAHASRLRVVWIAQNETHSDARAEARRLVGDYLRLWTRNGTAPLLCAHWLVEAWDLLLMAIDGLFDVETARALYWDVAHALAESDQTSDADRLRSVGLLAYHLGDPFAAEVAFDALDTLDESDLLGQMYLVRCANASERSDEAEARLAVAVEVAVAVLDASNPPTEILYYAGQLFQTDADDARALKCFRQASAQGHLAATYLLALTAYRLGDKEAEQNAFRAVLNAEQHLRQSGSWGFLGSGGDFELDADAPSGMTPLFRGAQLTEIGEAMSRLFDWLSEQRTESNQFLESGDLHSARAAYDQSWSFADDLMDETNLPGAWQGWTLSEASRTRLMQNLAARRANERARLKEIVMRDFPQFVDATDPPDILERQVADKIEGMRESDSWQPYRDLALYMTARGRLDPLVALQLSAFAAARSPEQSALGEYADEAIRGVGEELLKETRDLGLKAVGIYAGALIGGAVGGPLGGIVGSVVAAAANKLLVQKLVQAGRSLRETPRSAQLYGTFKADFFEQLNVVRQKHGDVAVERLLEALHSTDQSD